MSFRLAQIARLAYVIVSELFSAPVDLKRVGINVEILPGVFICVDLEKGAFAYLVAFI